MYFFPLGTFLGSAGIPLSGNGELAGLGGRAFGAWVWEKEIPGPTRQPLEGTPVLRARIPWGCRERDGRPGPVLNTPSLSYDLGQMAYPLWAFISSAVKWDEF